jgi:ADP-dependent NAD(P)H-hydrate dehydratase / NAD(P)H-hydrate epimerase
LIRGQDESSVNQSDRRRSNHLNDRNVLQKFFWRTKTIGSLVKYPEKTDRLEQRQWRGIQPWPRFCFWSCLTKQSSQPNSFSCRQLTHRWASNYHPLVQPVISSAQMREIDRLTTDRFQVPSLTLMENAATATARVVAEVLSGTASNNSVLVLCGRGNNGGDGAATARLLIDAGAVLDVALLGRVEETKGDASANFRRLSSLKGTGRFRFFECTSTTDWENLIATELSRPYDLFIDAILGTGLTRPVEGLFKDVVQFLNQEPRPTIVSIDVPSGLNSDSGQTIGEAVRADLTVTMTAPKPANVLPPATNYNGRLIVAGIGSPDALIEESKPRLFLSEAADARRWLIQTRYTPDSYKNTHGHALVIAGSRGFTGAAALCGNAAIRSGAGLVTVATPLSAQPLVATQVMAEVMTAALPETDRGTVSDDAANYALKLADRAQVIAIGPGLSAEDDRTRKFVRDVIAKRKAPVVIDADGLNCLAPWPADLSGSDQFPIVLTPHPGEMLRLMGTDDRSALDDRVAAAREFAMTHGVILLLKGTRSLIAAADGRVFVNPTGNPGLGTAGAGDTLTGIIIGFLAQVYGLLKEKADALETVIAALYVSGLAGDFAAREIGMRTMVASDIREHLSPAIRYLDPTGEVPQCLKPTSL